VVVDKAAVVVVIMRSSHKDRSNGDKGSRRSANKRLLDSFSNRRILSETQDDREEVADGSLSGSDEAVDVSSKRSRVASRLKKLEGGRLR
jgi:hypothetical protein